MMELIKKGRYDRRKTNISEITFSKQDGGESKASIEESKKMPVAKQPPQVIKEEMKEASV